MSSKQLALHELVDELTAAFKDGCSLNNNPERVHSILENCTTDIGEFEKFAFFEPNKLYTRNLVAQNEYFNLMLLCWNPSKGSPIHDHAGSGCWYRVVSGELRETLYDLEGSKPVEKSDRQLPENVVGYITDDVGVHRVYNPSETVPAMSLHCYAPAFDVCKMFKNGQVLPGRQVFFSEYGAKVEYGQQA